MTPRTAACALTALLVLAAGTPATAEPAAGSGVRPDGHVLLAWLHGGTSDDYRTQAEHLPGVTVLTPTWWTLDDVDPGGVVDEADPAFTAWAGERGMAVWPQISNLLDADLTEAALSSPERRARLVRETSTAVARAGAQGLVVAFENLHERTGPGLTALVRELRAALPRQVVAVAVAPLTASWSRGTWSTAYERRALGEEADYLLLTALDQDAGTGRPGPVAGLEWTMEAVEQLLSTVPDHKVLLTVPLYSGVWAHDPAAPGGAARDVTLGMDAMARRLDAAGATHRYDPVAGQRRYTYTAADGRRQAVWQEDPASLARRGELATAYNLGGLAGWRAGFAGPEAWDALSTALAANPRPPGPASGPPRLNRLVPVPRAADPAPEVAARQAGSVETAGGPREAPRPVVPMVVAAVLLVAVAAGLLGRWRGAGPLTAPRAGGRARR